MEKLEVSFEQLRKAIGKEEIKKMAGFAKGSDDAVMFGMIMSDYDLTQICVSTPFKKWSMEKVRSRIGVLKRSIVYTYRQVNPTAYRKLANELNKPKTEQSAPAKKFHERMAEIPEGSEVKHYLTLLFKTRDDMLGILSRLDEIGFKITFKPTPSGIPDFMWNPPASFKKSA